MAEDVSLYRKYRPQTFENLVGQDHIRTTLLNALRKKHLAHAYLFCGPRGTGKTSTARLIAKGLNCLNLQKNAEPCNECEICIDIMEGKLIDIIEIDAASNRGIDEIRDLREKVRFAPTHAAKKVYIIDEVHMLTKEAFNALLKMLEEPPSHANFILATTEAYKVPETIISRCQRFDFKRITVDVIVNRLNVIAKEEGVSVEERALYLVARYAQGGLRDAIGLMEQMIMGNAVTFAHVKDYLGLAGEKTLTTFIDLLRDREVTKALEHINTVYQEGTDLQQFNMECLSVMRDYLLEAVSKDEHEDISRFIELISIFQEAAEGLKSASIPQLPLEMAIIQSCFGDRVHRSIRTETAVAEPSSVSRNVQAKHPTIKALPKDVPAAPKFSLPPASDNEAGATEKVLSLDTIKQYWPRVLEHIKNPAVRMSLSQGQIRSLEAQTLTMTFNSRFHMEKVDDPKNKSDIGDALESIFKKNILVETELKEIHLDPTESVDSDNIDDIRSDFTDRTTGTPVKENSADPDLAEKAAKLFGAEVVEEDE